MISSFTLRRSQVFLAALPILLVGAFPQLAAADNGQCETFEGSAKGQNVGIGGQGCPPVPGGPVVPIPDTGQPDIIPVIVPDGGASQYRYWEESGCTDLAGNVDFVCMEAAPQCGPDESLVQTWRILNKPDQDPRTARPIGGPRCVGPNDPQLPRPEEDPVVTLEDFQRLGIISAKIGVQPRPHTLIRANNNFYADVETQTFNITLLNKAVEVRATPVSYTWNYGDGNTRGPMPESGVALHDSDLGEETFTSYAYQETGDYNVQLTTFFRGEFSVEGGPWQAIRGQAQVASEPATMSVWRSESRLVSGTCDENPDAWGC